MNPRKKLVVVGGGAAGYFCAVNAARLDPLLDVVLLEKTGKLLSKVKVSGGGRCNVTNNCLEIDVMSRQYPRGRHFLKKAFHHFFTTDTINWFAERGVPLKSEEDGRIFPVTDRSQTIIDCLLREADRYHVEIRMNTAVRGIEKKGDKFIVKVNTGTAPTPNSDLLTPNFLCIATGGYPKSSMFDWLKNTGHTIIDPVPSLFTFNLPGHPISKLMGISVENAKVSLRSLHLEEEGPLLITHWGLSGPAVLRLSAWGAREMQKLQWQFECRVNWVPAYSENTLRETFRQFRVMNASKKISGRNEFGLPSRLWDFLANESGILAGMRWADLPAATENKFIQALCNWTAAVKGKTTFKEEFVTAGGIKLSEIDPHTMMSKKLAGLYFAGEIMDVDGITGGYNFQHAWTSGFVAGKSIAGLGK
jgi:predicted Rossmann fold flavoprotein